MSIGCVRTGRPDFWLGDDLVCLTAVTTSVRINAASPSFHGLHWAHDRHGRSARAADNGGAKYLITELAGAILQAVVKMRDSKR